MKYIENIIYLLFSVESDKKIHVHFSFECPFNIIVALMLLTCLSDLVPQLIYSVSVMNELVIGGITLEEQG